MPDIAVLIDNNPLNVNIDPLNVAVDITDYKVDVNVTPLNILASIDALSIVVTVSNDISSLSMLQRSIKELVDLNHVYDSDESAAIGGIELGEVYLTANNHVQAPGGLLKIRLL